MRDDLTRTAPLVGLRGYAGAGKDEAAKGLLPEGFNRVAFADALKDVLREVDPQIVTYLDGTDVWEDARLSRILTYEGWSGAKERPEVRQLLQRLGVAVRTYIDPDAWATTALRKIAKDGDGKYVITDVRFQNEAAAIRSLGGILVNIVRPGVGPVNDHISESDLDGYSFDHTLLNDGSVELLHEKIRRIVRDYAV